MLRCVVAVLAVVAACGRRDVDVIEEAAVRPAPAPVWTHPSVQYYPSPDPGLQSSLVDGEPLPILRALGSTFAPHRPTPEEWDRTGYIRLDGEPTGFVRVVEGEVQRQVVDRYDLSCAGGFLEGVRLLLLPEVELDALGECNAELLAAVEGTPESCDHAGDFGTIALANIAMHLRAEQLPRGRSLHASRIRTRDDVEPDEQARLCTVSHASRARDGAVFDHHMMMLFPPDDAGRIYLFDTTGSRGVALRSRTAPDIAKYIKHLLADNDAYAYDPNTAELTCLTVAL